MMVQLKEGAVVVDDVIAIFCPFYFVSLRIIAGKKTEMSLTTNSKNN